MFNVGVGIRRRFGKAMKAKAKKFAVLLAGLTVFIAPASAQNETYSINWTEIGNLIGGVGNLMPSIGNLVVAVVPILLLLIVVGFLIGLFDSIIGAIKDAFRFFGR